MRLRSIRWPRVNGGNAAFPMLAFLVVFLAPPGPAAASGGGAEAAGQSRGEKASSLDNEGLGQGARVCVTGRLTDEGVECQAFRARDGRLFTLVGDLQGLTAGNEVCVCGTLPAMSFCMQGITLAVTRDTLGSDCPE